MTVICQPGPTDVWRKPRRVALSDGVLLADFGKCATYPLLDAARDGRALQALSEAETEAEACRFTQNWGFLHHRFESGRWDRFPLALFRLHRRYFLALARLCEAVRSRPFDTGESRAALRALKASRAEREAYIYPTTDARRNAVRDALQSIGVADGGASENSLTTAERALADQGVPIPVLVMARGERRSTVSLTEYAARTVALELSAGLLSHWRPVLHKGSGRQYGGWDFEDIPIVNSLQDVLMWTVRLRYRVLHHFFCESCGRESTSWRSDKRFCSAECGTRARVQRFRCRVDRR